MTNGDWWVMCSFVQTKFIKTYRRFEPANSQTWGEHFNIPSRQEGFYHHRKVYLLLVSETSNTLLWFVILKCLKYIQTVTVYITQWQYSTTIYKFKIKYWIPCWSSTIYQHWDLDAKLVAPTAKREVYSWTLQKQCVPEGS